MTLGATIALCWYMYATDLFKAADYELRRFSSAPDLAAAEESYRTIREVIVPALEAEDPTMGQAVRAALDDLVNEKIERKWIPST
jgi:hypothetical protein